MQSPSGTAGPHGSPPSPEGATIAPADFKSAAGTAVLAARWAYLEAPFRSSDHRGTEPPDAVAWSGPGRSALVFTAPHAVSPWRNGLERHADPATGGLAILLAELTGGRALVAMGRQSGDPNHDLEPGPFKVALLDGLRAGDVVIDIHGMNDGHPEDLILGRGPHPALSAGLADALLGCGLPARSGHPFDARHPGTITAFAQGLGFRAVQVEVTSRRRKPRLDPEAANELVERLLPALIHLGSSA